MIVNRIVDRNIPKETEAINFNFKDDETFGMLNLCNWREEIDNIENADKIVMVDKAIEIHFPLHNNFYVKRYSSNDGFTTFRELMNKIEETGIEAFEWDIEENPENYFNGRKAMGKDIIKEYGITWSPKDSDIDVKGDKVYVSIQH